jgi:hypothetical protein
VLLTKTNATAMSKNPIIKNQNMMIILRLFLKQNIVIQEPIAKRTKASAALMMKIKK